MPSPEHHTLAEGSTVVNDLLPYWIHHGRIRVVPAIERFDASNVHFVDGTNRTYDTILWATGFHASLPFLDTQLVPRSGGSPNRHAAGIPLPGLEKLYLVGMAAPRGPQIPISGMQTKLIARMLKLNEHAGPGGAGITEYLSGLQEPESRIDIARDIWLAQMDDTSRLLDALQAASNMMAKPL